MNVRKALILLSAAAICGLCVNSFAQDSSDKPVKPSIEDSNKKKVKLPVADQLIRDSTRLNQIKTIAALPVIEELCFTGDKRIPDPKRMYARLAIANRLPSIVESEMKTSNYSLLPPEAGSLALKTASLLPTDVYVTQSAASWGAPAETLKNRQGDVCDLLTSRDEMKKSPGQVSLCRYKLHDFPDTVTCLETYHVNPAAELSIEKIKDLGGKLAADAMLICRVTDMNVQEGGAGGYLNPYTRAVTVNVEFALVASSDGAVIWQARAKGRKASISTFFKGYSSLSGEDRLANVAAELAAKSLIDDLVNGTGKPVK